jgi:hypothetical protein
MLPAGHTRRRIQANRPVNLYRKYIHIPTIIFITSLLRSTKVTITITEPPIRCIQRDVHLYMDTPFP